MKIIHILASDLSIKYGGGLPIAAHRLAKEQQDIGNDVEILIVGLSKTDTESRKGIISATKYICGYHPDIVVFHGIYFLQYPIISYLLKRKKISYCIEPHGAFCAEAQKKGKLKKRIANATFFRHMINNASAIVYLCEEEKDKTIYKDIKWIIVPNGCDEADHKCEHSKEVSFFYLGRIDIRHKGLDMMLDAIEQLRAVGNDSVFRIYGGGSVQDESYLSERIKNLHNCFFYGTVSGKEKEKIFRDNNIMVLTSRYEGMPLTVLEALANGCPCVVTEGTNMSNMLVENRLGWKCGFTCEEIAETFIEALDQYSKNVSDYTDRTQNYVKTHYSWKHVAEISCNEYRKLGE